jgi:uncharacterized oligopeptide transporter (OPT) family protein
MTLSAVNPDSAASRGPGSAAALAVGLIAGVTVLALVVAGLAFVGLAIAFQVAIPIAEAYHLPVSAADAALAERFADVWWAFAALAIGSFSAAAVIVVKLISVLSPTPRD